MAATAITTSFLQSLKCTGSKNWQNDNLLKISCPRSVSLSYSLELNPINSLCSKWRVPRLVAAVAQEESAPVEEETPPTVEEEEEIPPTAEEGVLSDEVAAVESSRSTKLYFGNLPYHCDSAVLAGIVSEYGHPELIEVLYNRDTGKSRGFAFVTMSSVEECNRVIENLDGSDYGGRVLRVNFSDKPRPKEPLYPETEHKLFIGNLSWDVNSEILAKAFEEYGEVVGARVLIDGDTGKSRGYGFVSYKTRDEMEAAMEALDGMELEGRSIRVQPAQGKN